MGLKHLVIGAGLGVLACGFLIWVAATDYLSGDFQETRVYEQLQYWLGSK